MTIPVLVEVTRGPIVESHHHVSVAVALASGELVLGLGDVDTPTYLRSSAKPFQALAFIAGGGAERFALTVPEVALLCASHSGEPRHVEAARSILGKLGLSQADLECGPQWPMRQQAAYDLARAGGGADALHHPCSGKHSGMLGLARVLGADPASYVAREHPVQMRIAEVIGEICGVPALSAPCGVDGCSVPTWAFPLRAAARGFARFATGEGMSPALAKGAANLRAAVAADPFMVAGTGRFCTEMMMAAGPGAFVKTGAEGVMCAGLPRRGLGIAIKCADGAARAAELVMAHLLAQLGAVDGDSPQVARHLTHSIVNPKGVATGVVRAAPALVDALAIPRGAMTA